MTLQNNNRKFRTKLTGKLYERNSEKYYKHNDTKPSQYKIIKTKIEKKFIIIYTHVTVALLFLTV